MNGNMLTAASAVKQANNQCSVEEWEIEKIGDFLLGLYHQQVISSRTYWLIPKRRLRLEFDLFLNKPEHAEEDLRARFKQASGTDVLGKLLWRTGFLINTARKSEEYLIKNIALFRHSNQKLEQYDKVRRNGEITELQENSLAIESFEKEHDLELSDCFKVDEDAIRHKLVYQGSDLQDRKDDFMTVTDQGCYICQENYDDVEIFEAHVEFHGSESDFEFLKMLKKTETHVWTISYRECQNSHYFCFTMETAMEELLVIEKIIVIQSRSMYYVHNSRVPYSVPGDGKVKFFVDSRLFRINLEQPIVIVFHQMGKEHKRWIEQHHFLRTEQLPKVVEDNNPRRLPNKIIFKAKINLPQYLPSAEVRAAFNRDDVAIEPLCDMSNEFKGYMQNGKELTRENVRPVLNVLLQIEDWTIIRAYKDLVQRQVTLRKIENEYSLFLKTTKNVYVENILSQYDEVFIIAEASDVDTLNQEERILDLLMQNTDDLKTTCAKGQKKRKTYFGQVDRYVNGRVVFTCKKLLPKNTTFTLIFRPARLVTRYQFRALELLSQLSREDVERFFFPGVVMPTDFFKLTPQCFSGLNLQNKSIYNNPEQLQAVHYISRGPSREAPYIVFGPPGTGKTTTLVEAIYQLYKSRPFTKILLTAGSNGACDEIALRLCRILSPHEDTRAIVRIYSKSCEERADGIDKDLLKASNMYSSQFYPDINILHQYRIVVCTLSVSSKLATGKFGKDSTGAPMFSHVFVDEAGASTEAETLMGIINGLSPRASLIISGDHKQLGPILRSDRAAELGLSVSLLERLLSCCCYNVGENGDYNHHIQTRLRTNYRSHPQIVGLYNSLYYNNELKALTDISAVNLCERWHKAPNPKYPIMFHSVFGTSERQTNSGSLYNQRELEVVMDYVKDLMYFGINGEKISQSDIGIISPYKSQYLRIQEQLNLRNWYEIETGSVETFQGKEKAIIIASFVRSFTSTLGFLDNPRRLNVTISRPKALLILIGNPTTLSLNRDFKYIIEECQSNNSMVGSFWRDGTEEATPDYYAKEANKMENLRKQFEQLSTGNASAKEVRPNNQNRKAKKIADRNSNNKKTQKASEHNGQLAAQPKLGHAMKKSVNPTSQQKQRQKFAACKKIVSKESEQKTEIDLLFEELPKLPQALKKPDAFDSSVSSQVFYNMNSPNADCGLKGASASNMNQPNAHYNSQGASASNMGQLYAGLNINQSYTTYGQQGMFSSNLNPPYADYNSMDQPYAGHAGYPSQISSAPNPSQSNATYGQQGLFSSNLNPPNFGSNSHGASVSPLSQPYAGYIPYEPSAPNLSQSNVVNGPHQNSFSNMNMQGVPSCKIANGSSGTKSSVAANDSKPKASSGTESSKPGFGSQATSSSSKKSLNSKNGSQATVSPSTSNTGTGPQSTSSSGNKSSNASNGSQATGSSGKKSLNGSQTSSSSSKKPLNSDNRSQAAASLGMKSPNAGSAPETNGSSDTKSFNGAYGSQATGSSVTAPTYPYGSQTSSSSATKPTNSAYNLQGLGSSNIKSSNAIYGSQTTESSATTSHPMDPWSSSTSTTANNPSDAIRPKPAGSAGYSTPYAAAQRQVDAARREQHSFGAPRYMQPESGTGFVNLPYNTRRTPEVAYEAFGRQSRGPTAPKPKSSKDSFCTIS